MKKRVITGMMTASVIVSLAGCGAGQKENVESTAPATMTETVAASQVETAEVTETETTVQADRASRIKAYQAALENIYQNHILPDGSELRDDISGEMSGNKFAVYDVDHDGREELVFCYTATSMASMTAKIYDYDEASGELYEELSQFPMLTFYDNATIGAGISHNQGYAGEFWPYTFYTYDAANDSYRAEYFVDAWDKSLSDVNYNGEAFRMMRTKTVMALCITWMHRMAVKPVSRSTGMLLINGSVRMSVRKKTFRFRI